MAVRFSCFFQIPHTGPPHAHGHGSSSEASAVYLDRSNPHRGQHPLPSGPGWTIFSQDSRSKGPITMCMWDSCHPPTWPADWCCTVSEPLGHGRLLCAPDHPAGGCLRPWPLLLPLSRELLVPTSAWRAPGLLPVLSQMSPSQWGCLGPPCVKWQSVFTTANTLIAAVFSP